MAQEKSVNPEINKSFVKPDVAAFVERFESEGREVYDHREEIIEACQLKPGMVVADIGAGTGLFTRMIAPRVTDRGQVFAVDIAKEFVEHVEKVCQEAGATNVKGVVCTSESTELPANSVDLAFICDTYHHFEFPYKTMRSLHRALKPNGQVVLVDFDRVEGKSSDWILNHLRAGKATFVKEVELAGFEVAEEQDFLATSYWIRFKKSDRKTNSNHTTDSIEDIKRLIAEGTAKLIDVREQAEWEAGHLAAAELIPLSMLKSLPADELSTKLAEQLPKDKIIYCHCRSGSRVLAATPILQELGYDIRPLALGYSLLVDEGFEKAE
ncbi:MAG: methyltransferase domain-containing protein [Planctomycetaceae bacterium]|nr:methyltransferase domain-containing protein [Planctomycetales bacterium]MCB9874715.1 methyltransferase domain-containing protein [Planctomycetaceae bacterium]MCB9941844.1 methyltransferase domain-containing protein [Planctomycetaceae bacterium]